MQPLSEKERIKELVRQGNVAEMGKHLFRTASSGDLTEEKMPVTLEIVGKWEGEISLAPSATTATLKERISQASGMSPSDFKLVCEGVTLKATATLQSLGVTHNSQVRNLLLLYEFFLSFYEINILNPSCR